MLTQLARCSHPQPSLFHTATLSNRHLLVACVHTRYLEAQTKVFSTIGMSVSHLRCYFLLLTDYCRTACKHAACKLRKQSYKGYSLKREAHNAYNLFVSHGILPVGIPAPDPNDGGPSYPPQLPSTPASSPRHGTPAPSPQCGIPSSQHRTPLSQCGTPLSHHRSPLSHRFITGQQPLNITINNNMSKNPATSIIPVGQLASTSSVDESDLLHDDYKFWVVFTGASPGVYEGRHVSSFSQILFMLKLFLPVMQENLPWARSQTLRLSLLLHSKMQITSLWRLIWILVSRASCSWDIISYKIP